MTFDVRRMLLLAQVARQGSITGAAAALNYTPSAVSQQISRLEAEAGQPLLDRRARGITLTDAGRAVLVHAERIDRELRAARTELDDLAGLREGTLRIGTFPTVAASFLPLVVREFRARHPGVELIVRSSRNAGLVELLDSHEVELSLLWDYEWRRLADPGLDITYLLDDPTTLIVSTAHRLAGRKSTTFAELAGEQWIVRDDHPVAEVLTRSCHAAGFEPSIAYRAHDYQEAQAMAAVGIGIALAPRLALTGLRDDVTTVALGPSAPARRILLATVQHHRPTPAAAALRAVFLATAANLRDAGGNLDHAVRRAAPRP
ncbi:LysR substrate-binding domain-containing protein [Amycolatopsis acidiphila]|uniref:LysR family transcriptional regulator n=1 Tax=Amycolatopsis acidiphila TaxID=715473 RepID=A0A558AFC4_9PSEU|nr:LysR family transcriptional regulator [Amycolatopsis acidiphila]TVT22959.1 LysR family transcriptional regulator [Amycolatopsis acidiphila]UIJ57120.1 LysR substrate-binding domain-containing protein [Amycolatopsis acidiphila]GHG53254.1 LysR family transcriptional regulator [Amycolatopsis acidiphila]